MSTFSITPIVVALGPHREASRFTYLNHFGEKIDIPYMAWLIRNKDLVALVDTGCSADAYQQHLKPKGQTLYVGGEQFADVVDVTPLEQGLAQHGLTVDDVDVVIQTHLDWDHCMNTPAFKRSRIIIQKAEMADWPVHRLFSRTHPPHYIYEEIKALNLAVIEGDYRIADGLEVLYTPGHTAGGQSVLVRAKTGAYVITGLCTVKANYYLSDEEKERLGYEVMPPATHLDVRDAYASVLRIRQVGGERVIANHDPANVSLGVIE